MTPINPSATIEASFTTLVDSIQATFVADFAGSLLALIQFGSTVRRPIRRETDIDLLAIFQTLPAGRMARHEFLLPAEEKFGSQLKQLRSLGANVELSVISRTKEEAKRYSPLYLDMVGNSRVLFDPGGVAAAILARTERYILESGAKRVVKGDLWYWDLRPDYQPGDSFDVGF